ncbi:MAG: tetracycline resistance MFS efflux pump, partial [Alphaproteobacteria bacterium RIFCSPHIGHO2_12_FULL_66_14]
SLVLLFVGRVVSGITAATITTSMAYIADVTPADRRAKAFGIVGMAFGLGFVLGPAIGGLLGGLDPRLPFWVSAAACLVNAAFGWFVLPESLPPERRMAFSWKRASPLGSLALLRSHTQLLGLAAANFFGQVAHHVLPAVFVLYGAYRYGWGETVVGLTLAGVGVCSAVVQGLLVGPAVARLGERWAMIMGLLFGAAGMVIYGLAPTGLWFWIGVPVMSLWGLAGPASQSLMSRLVGPSEQGQLQGANTALMSIAGLAAPGLFALTFAYFIEPLPGRLQLPGAPYLLAALLLILAAATAERVTAPRRPGGRHR